jgi:hypothetical protein
MNTPQDGYRQPPQGQTGDGRQASEGIEEFARSARVEGQQRVRQYRDVAADKIDTLADSAQAAAAQLQDDDLAQLSGHIGDMARRLSRLSDSLREKSADEILRDVRRAARENPTLFLAGSIAIGFGIARFARASSPGERSDERDDRADAVPGTTARPAAGDGGVATASPGTLEATPGPAAADALSARAGAAASDIAEPDIESADSLRGRNQP